MTESKELQFLRCALASVSSGAKRWQEQWRRDIESWKRIAGEHEEACAVLEQRLAMLGSIEPTGTNLLTLLDRLDFPEGDNLLIARAAELDKVEAMQDLLAKVEALKLCHPLIVEEFGLLG